MTIMLGPNRYGKAEVRLVRVVRDGPRHELRDLNVSVSLAGDLADTHRTGDNTQVLPTDTQKNTVYAFARRHGIVEIERFGLVLARHFVDTQPAIHTARVEIEEYPWRRLGPHSFQREGGETRLAAVTVTDRPDPAGTRKVTVESGLTGLVLLNSTDSEFSGYVRDEYTTLPETTDRVLATAVDARWRYGGSALDADDGSLDADADADADVGSTGTVDFDRSREGARVALVAAFVETYSYSLQQTLYAMGERVLRQRPEIAEIRLALPNRHHLLVDLTPFGLDNPGEVFVATDRPYGLIEATVTRSGGGER